MKRLLTLCTVTFLFLGANAQNMDSIYRVYFNLYNSPDEKDKAELNTRLENDLKSDNEVNWRIAWFIYKQTGRREKADSIMQAGKKRWPDGKLVPIELWNFVAEEKDPFRKDSLFQKYLRLYPATDPKDERVTENLRGIVAAAWLKVGYVSKAMSEIALIKDPQYRHWMGRELYYKELCKEASAIFIQTLETEKDYAFPSMVFFANMDYKNAEKYIAMAYKENPESPFVLNIYYQTLKMQGKDQQEMDIIATAMRSGCATTEMKADFKNLYVKLKGSEDGYDAYFADLRKVYLTQLDAHLKKTLVSEPAPNFTLTNLEGKQVTLSELKGKVVILDFWATWCGPCVGSFPAMKAAMQRFEKDPDVKFLFINTWEAENNEDAKIRKFITDNQYPFEVPVDVKNYKVATAYKVNGIPAKFVIDKDGNIRFRFLGYNGSDESTTEEVSAMITMLKDGNNQLPANASAQPNTKP